LKWLFHDRLDLYNWRGIFVSSVLRTILMKLVNERAFEKVDKTMTDSQIGARKHKSVRNHLFVLNAILSDVMTSKKKKHVDLNVMDFKQMFDSEDAITCLTSLYSAGVQDDIFALIYEAKKTIYFKVKTPSGKTVEEKIENNILQGDVITPLISSNMVEKNISREAMKNKQVYLCKDKIEIPPLIMQDDILTITGCGNNEYFPKHKSKSHGAPVWS
jgi:hypothetical protein